MWRTFWLFGVAALLVLGAAPAARADTVYTYTGTDFTSFDSTGLLPAGVVSLSGSVTLTTALGDNFSGFVSPSAFSFSDGATTITQANLSLPYDTFYFVTDSSGAITNWDVELCAIGPSCVTPVVYFETINSPSSGTDDYAYYVDGSGGWALAIVSSSPGTWTDPAITAPEPSALLLLGSGLIGLIAARRRKSLSQASASS
jgi:PEP-CTERM motif-containing protein